MHRVQSLWSGASSRSLVQLIPMRVAVVTTDARGSLVPADLPRPVFGTAPEALIQGFASLPEAEVHVLSCVQQRVEAPARLALNIFFHSLVAPKIGWLR